MTTTFSIYDNALTSELLHRCDGPVTLDVLTSRVADAVREGKYSPEAIAAASVEAINVLKAHDGYMSSNEFNR